MKLQEYNERVKAIGKDLFGENYQFSSTSIESTNYGHIDEIEVKYRATIFLKKPIGSCGNISGSSIDVEIVFDLIKTEHKKLLAKPSTNMEL